MYANKFKSPLMIMKQKSVVNASIVGCFAFVLTIALTLPAPGQSFLSRQRQTTDITADVSLQEDTEKEPSPQFEPEPGLSIDEQPSATGESVHDGSSDVSGDSGMMTEYQTDLSFQALYEIEMLIKEGRYNFALARLEKLRVNSGELIWAYIEFQMNEFRLFLQIKAHFHLGNMSEVEKLSEKYITNYGNADHLHWVIYYLSSVRFSQKKPLQFVYLVTEDFFKELPTRERHNLRKFLIEDALRNEEYLTAVNFLEDEEGNILKAYRPLVGEILSKIDDIDDIDHILDRYQNTTLINQLRLRKIQIMVRNNNMTAALDYFNQLYMDMTIDAGTQSEFNDITDFVRFSINTEPRKIGVILPLSHRSFRRYAIEVMDGLQLALQDVKIDGRPVELVIKDSSQRDSHPDFLKLTPKRQLLEKQQLVKSQVRDLVENQHVIAILGPLARSTSLAAGEAAQQYKVPVISFSITENIGEEFPSLFRFQKSQLQEARVIARYAVDYLQARRFVLFYEDNKKGFEVMQAFRDEIESAGCEVTGIAQIRRNQVDFNDTFKSFTGGFEVLSEEEEEELKLTRENPEPVIDFDAVFLPVDTRPLKVIIDFAKLFDADKVWFLAGSEINVRENQLLSSTYRLRFVDAFPVSNRKTLLQPFFESHWRFFNFRQDYYPPTDYTIFGYEALEIVTKLLDATEYRNREALRDALRNLENFKVLTGYVNTEVNGELAKELKILKIQNTDTVEAF